MRTFVKPAIIVSRCLEFAPCRWNGQVIAAPFVRRLEPFVSFTQVCPEMEIGLGVPRDPIRVISVGGKVELFQPSTQRLLTHEMASFAAPWLSARSAVDGFILKSRSPSCGIKDVKVYAGTAPDAQAVLKGSGLFGGTVLQRFPGCALEDEGRLGNYAIREHFLTRIFAAAELRAVHAAGQMGRLVQFHAMHKLTLMAYSQSGLRTLGRIVANAEKRPFEQVAAAYEAQLQAAFARPPRSTANINVLMHALGYFKDELGSDEKQFFLAELEKYRNEQLPLSSVVGVLRAWVVRFSNEYLAQQTFFEPYPLDLTSVLDSGKGRPD